MLRARIGSHLRAHRLHIAATALVLYLLAIPATIFVFPNDSIWLALLIINASAVQSVLTIADLLTDEPPEA